MPRSDRRRPFFNDIGANMPPRLIARMSASRMRLQSDQRPILGAKPPFHSRQTKGDLSFSGRPRRSPRSARTAQRSNWVSRWPTDLRKQTAERFNRSNEQNIASLLSVGKGGSAPPLPSEIPINSGTSIISSFVRSRLYVAPLLRAVTDDFQWFPRSSGWSTRHEMQHAQA